MALPSIPIPIPTPTPLPNYNWVDVSPIRTNQTDAPAGRAGARQICEMSLPGGSEPG